MSNIYKNAEGERAVGERYLQFLRRWPVPNQQLRVRTREGETFVIASGPEGAPPVVLLHGGAANSAAWMGDIAAWAAHFRVYAVDLIGEPGLSAPSRPPLSSEAHALWLDDVLQALSLRQASFVGVSLGGWMALDYATRRSERVESLVVLCPGGIGRQKVGIVFKTIFLRMCGSWGKQKLRESILGRTPPEVPAAVGPFVEFFALIHEQFQPRMVRLPRFCDEALKKLTMPALAIVGGQDVLLDSAETRRRLQTNVPRAEVRYLPEAGHFLSGQRNTILEFLAAQVRV
jgi:pimeloyl-ACP methyl ester carboxylesterase